MAIFAGHGLWRGHQRLLVLGLASTPVVAAVELELEYLLLLVLFSLSFIIPVIIMIYLYRKQIVKNIIWFIKEAWENTKRGCYLFCTGAGHKELSEKYRDCCDDCCGRCCTRKKKKQSKRKKKDPLQGVDLRYIVAAPRPPGALDHGGDSGGRKGSKGGKGGTGMSRAEKLKKAQAKGKEKGKYTKEFRVVERDSAGNEYVTQDTTHRKKKKKHHSKKDHKAIVPV
jgi:hypothetical protein